jgi:hypothetical protein
MSGPIRIGPDGEPIQGVREVRATAHPVMGTFSVTATVGRKIYTFRCSNKSDLFAVSLDPHGSNLPRNICTGDWLWHGEAVAEPGDHIAGFVSRDLFRDLDRQGYHLASGVRVTVSRDFEMQVEVGKALASANASTRFFPTDTDA